MLNSTMDVKVHHHGGETSWTQLIVAPCDNPDDQSVWLSTPEMTDQIEVNLVDLWQALDRANDDHERIRVEQS